MCIRYLNRWGYLKYKNPKVSRKKFEIENFVNAQH